MADFHCKNNEIKCTTQFPWEKQFQKVYTNSIFRLVQEEVQRMLCCHIVPPTEDEALEDLAEDIGIEKFWVLERSIVNNFFFKEFTYTVSWRSIGAYINCNCRKFEFKGILCCHIMEVLSQKNIRTVNERHLLRRWRKDVYRRHSSIFFAGSYPHMTEEYKKFQEVEKVFQECTDMAMDSVEKMDFIKQAFIVMKNELSNWISMPNDQNVEEVVGDVQSVGENVRGSRVLDHNVARSRGRPRENRFCRLWNDLEVEEVVEVHKEEDHKVEIHKVVEVHELEIHEVVEVHEVLELVGEEHPHMVMEVLAQLT